MSVAMLVGRRLPRLAGWAGLLGNGLLLLDVALVAVVPSAGLHALVLALPGGLLALAWILLIGVGLLRAWRDLARAGAAGPAAGPGR